MTIFFGKDGDNLPVIPWYANFTATNTWSPPVWEADSAEILRRSATY